LLREIPLRAAIGEIDRVLIGLGEVGGSVPERENEPAPLELAGERGISGLT